MGRRTSDSPRPINIIDLRTSHATFKSKLETKRFKKFARKPLSECLPGRLAPGGWERLPGAPLIFTLLAKTYDSVSEKYLRKRPVNLPFGRFFVSVRSSCAGGVQHNAT